MSTSTKFCVLYQFKVRPGMEATFQEGWSRTTEAIRETYGGLGSRLHRSEEGLWVAYAQWPDRETWERSRLSDTWPDPEAGEMMTAAMEGRLAPMLLEPKVDLLVPCPAVPAIEEAVGGVRSC